jgi:hypothetical protein
MVADELGTSREVISGILSDYGYRQPVPASAKID